MGRARARRGANARRVSLRNVAFAAIIVICFGAADAGAEDAPRAIPLPSAAATSAPGAADAVAPSNSPAPSASAATSAPNSVTPSPASGTVTPSPVPSVIMTPVVLPSPSISPPPSPVPPRDAAGINVTTPPIVPQSPVPTPTIPDALWFSPAETSTIPVEIHDGVVFVPVVADGRRRTFLLDTRGTTTIDNSALSAPASPANVLGTLQVGDVRLTNLLVSSARILPYAVTYLGASADGAVGTDFLSRYPVTIDYGNRRLTLYHSSADAELAERPAGTATISLAQGGGPPTTTARVADKFDGKFIFDSLATTEVVVSDGFARVHRLPVGGGWLDSTWLARPSGEIAGRMGRITSLALGSLSFQRPLTVTAGPSEPNALPRGADGAVGSWLLQRFTVTLDMPGERLMLAPASSTSTAPAQFDRSGAWLVQRSGFVEVRSVLPGSPADAARLRGGDQLLALNGRPVSALEEARAAFEGAIGSAIFVRFHHGIFTHTTKLTLHTVM